MYVAVYVNTQKLPAHILVTDHECPNPPHQGRMFPFNVRYSRHARVYTLHQHLMAPFLAYFPESSDSYPDSETTNKRFYCESSSKHQMGKFPERGLSYWKLQKEQTPCKKTTTKHTADRTFNLISG